MSTNALLDGFAAQATTIRPERGSVITIGNFDGVHRGHQAIIRTLCEAAEAIGASAVALTFEPHPTTFFQKRAAETFRLTSSERRRELLLAYGAEDVVTIPFESEFATLSAHDFVHELLHRRLHAREVHIGYDFAFGRGREGTTATLQEMCGGLGIRVKIHPAYEADDKPISSTRVRSELQAARLDEVERLLGRPWTLPGVQAPGFQRGRKMGVPTINLYPQDLLLPPHGVYVTRVRIGDQVWPSITNLGVRPTFADDPRVSAETFVLSDFEGLESGAALTLEFLAYVREERRFEDQDALRAQIGKDVEVAKAHHAARDAKV